MRFGFFVCDYCHPLVTGLQLQDRVLVCSVRGVSVRLNAHARRVLGFQVKDDIGLAVTEVIVGWICTFHVLMVDALIGVERHVASATVASRAWRFLPLDPDR